MVGPAMRARAKPRLSAAILCSGLDRPIFRRLGLPYKCLVVLAGEFPA